VWIITETGELLKRGKRPCRAGTNVADLSGLKQGLSACAGSIQAHCGTDTFSILSRSIVKCEQRQTDLANQNKYPANERYR